MIKANEFFSFRREKREESEGGCGHGQWVAKAGWVRVERLSRELRRFFEKVSGGISKMKSVGCKHSKS